ncbi:MAG: ATP-binding cassette domain-containing protein, partial [Planctomycetes bacterium]|nr:ATP-binding cassette domain-containing protein [Planctomycetota bacterium]
TVEAGEFVGYLGPNGAGKSTTIKMLSGILVPTSGEVDVCGIVPHRDRRTNAMNIGAVFGQRTQLWWDLPPSEAYTLLGKIYRIDRSETRSRVSELADLLEVGPVLDTPVRKLSLGQKMRCELVAALLHRPKVLFLDEPTIGLDAVGKAQVRRQLRSINREQGTTIVLTSHDLDDIEALCGRVLVIDHGGIIHDGTVETLRTKFGNRRTIVVDFAVSDPALAETLPSGATLDRTAGPRAWIDFDADLLTAPTLIRHLLETHEIQDLTVREIDIEEVVRRVYRG